MNPLPPTFIWVMFVVTAAAYAGSGVGVLVGRLRGNRWRGLLQQLEAAPSGPRAAEALSHASLAVLYRIASEATAPGDAQLAVMRALIHRVGVNQLRAAARRRTGRWSRIAALRTLAKSGDRDAIPCLEQAMVDGRQDVKAATVVLLGQLTHPAAAGLLIDALQDNRLASSRIAAAVDAQSVDAAAIVVPLLRAPHAFLRYWGALLVQRYGSLPGLTGMLGRLTADPDPSVRKASIDTIASLRFTQCAPQLRARLQDQVGFVRAHAARALGLLHDVSSAADVATLLADHDWQVRSAARQGLEAIGPQVEPVLIQTLSHTDPFARNGAAEALQNLGLLSGLVRTYIGGENVFAKTTMRRLEGAAGPRIWKNVLDDLAA
jgi:hypothetical protein